MRKHRNLLMKVIAFILLSGILVGCGTIAPDPTLKTTSTPVPMVRITIQLVDVFCDHKQDAFWFHDKFYLLSTFTAPHADPSSQLNTQAQLSEPLDITSGQDLQLPQSHVLAFDGLVPLNGSIKGGFSAHNDQKGLTWSNINVWVLDIGKSVANKLFDESLDSGSIGLVVASGVLDLGLNVWYDLAKMDENDSNDLGDLKLNVSASGPPSQEGLLRFQNSGGLGGVGGWDYTVRYLITRTMAKG